jgi:hypothetical protein
MVALAFLPGILAGVAIFNGAKRQAKTDRPDSAGWIEDEVTLPCDALVIGPME